MNGNKVASQSQHTKGPFSPGQSFSHEQCLGFRTPSENSPTWLPSLNWKTGHMEPTPGPCPSQLQKSWTRECVDGLHRQQWKDFVRHSIPRAKHRVGIQQMLFEWMVTGTDTFLSYAKEKCGIVQMLIRCIFWCSYVTATPKLIFIFFFIFCF